MDDFLIIVLVLVIVFLVVRYFGKIKSYFFADGKQPTASAGQEQDDAAYMDEATFRAEFFKALGGELTSVDENLYLLDCRDAIFGFMFYNGNNIVKIFLPYFASFKRQEFVKAYEIANKINSHSMWNIVFNFDENDKNTFYATAQMMFIPLGTPTHSAEVLNTLIPDIFQCVQDFDDLMLESKNGADSEMENLKTNILHKMNYNLYKLDVEKTEKVCDEFIQSQQTQETANSIKGIDCLFGAIAGDIIGSRYEFFPHKDKNFILFHNEYSDYTDDTVMTIANAHWLISDKSLFEIMQDYGKRYPTAGYGGMFKDWLKTNNPKPYNSFGNGSAMRVSPVGWAFDTLEKTLEVAKRSAEITHNQPEGIKGAQATAACIFLARTGKCKKEIKEYVEVQFGYNLNRTCDEIRPTYKFDGSCQGTVPESIIAFLESTDFESAIRLSVSLGGDADTMGTITGAIAEAFYGGVPEYIKEEVIKRLPNEFIEVMHKFYLKFVKK